MTPLPVHPFLYTALHGEHPTHIQGTKRPITIKSKFLVCLFHQYISQWYRIMWVLLYIITFFPIHHNKFSLPREATAAMYEAEQLYVKQKKVRQREVDFLAVFITHRYVVYTDLYNKNCSKLNS